MRGVVLDKATDKPRYTLLEENFSTRCGSALGLEIHNHGRYGNTTQKGQRHGHHMDRLRGRFSERGG